MRKINAVRHITLLTVALFGLSSCGSIWNEGMLGPLRKKDNTDMIQSQPLQDGDRAQLDPENMQDLRVIMLEEEVFRLQSELDQMKPALMRLKSLEQSLQDLLASLQNITAIPDQSPQIIADMAAKDAPQSLTKTPAPKQMEPIPEPEQKMAKTVTKAEPEQNQMQSPPASPSAASGTVTGMKMRVGEYPNKMRLVVEFQGTPDFQYDLDNQENLFTVIFDKGVTFDKGFNTWNFKGSLIDTASVSQNADQALLILALNKDSRVLNSGKILPNKDSDYTRVFFDFSK